MATAKVAITLDRVLLRKLDQMIERKVFPSRSKAIQEAVEEKIARLDGNRLAEECAKLDPEFEQSIAEEGLSMETEQWPNY